MPYNFRRSTKRFRRTGLNRYFLKKSGYFPNIKNLATDVKLLKGVINTEKKYFDTDTSGVTLPTSTTGTVTCINGMGQGDDNNERIGRSIRIKSVHVKGAVELNALATKDFIKVAVVLDHQTNGSAPGYSGIYDMSVNGAAYAYRSMSTPNRFRVLATRMIPLAKGGSEIKTFNMNIPCDIHTKYQTAGSGVASINSDGLFLVYGGDLSLDMSAIKYNCRIRYVDN